ncbi:ankyrin repeat domain-containing protein [Allohahella marinimesophila]|uniref:Ankyrin repeat protein n=1 Tax=Allohahella marinimesophila TaxID=1054972 RepID=A0ABP7PI03_9GAMM
MLKRNATALVLLLAAPLVLQGCATPPKTDATAVLSAVSKGDTQRLVNQLAEGADPNVISPENQETPLHIAARRGDSRAVQALAASGADLDARSSDGATPLALAITNGHLSTSKALIRAGARVNTEYQDKPLLMIVVEQGSLLMAQVMLSAGASVNARDADGDTALMVAVKKNNEDMQMLLRQSGGEI